MESITQKISQKMTRLQDLGIKEIGLFGSYVRGEETDSSDLDILIDIERPAKLDLLALISLEQELSDEKTQYAVIRCLEMCPVKTFRTHLQIS